MKKLTSLNPFTGQILEEFNQTSDEKIEQVLISADRRFQLQRRTSIKDRQILLAAVADKLDFYKAELAKTAVAEMGKTIVAARAEVEKCAFSTRYFAEHLAEILKDSFIQTGAKRQFIRPLPLGPILAVMPWNFPFWQVIRAAVPAIGAGNVLVLKHAANVSRCALWLERIFSEAGFAEGTFQTLLLESNRVARIISDRRIQGVTLTGSEAAGRAVAKVAGEYLKKTVLELGGSDPFIVMPSADLEQTVANAVTARILNNGQSCVAAKRFIVHQDILDAFLMRFQEKMAGLVVGDPMSEKTDVGPLVHREALFTLKDQVKRSINEGAKLVCGNQSDERQNLYSPSILLAPPFKEKYPSIFQEEFFGPSAMVYSAQNLEQAFQIANSSPFGLASSFWSHDRQEHEKAINQIEAGQTFINMIVASEPQLPFGGVKHSGYGRELGVLGAHEFVNMKSVSVAFAPTSAPSKTERPIFEQLQVE